MSLITGILLTLLASWLIAKASDGFETAADFLGRNMSEGMKGATINAIGSSMPELWVTFVYLFLYSDTTGFAGGIGTTAGSAVFNAMVIPALVIISVLWISPKARIQVAKPVILRDGLTLICAEFFLIYFLGVTLNWYHGFFLMILYIAYISWMIYRQRNDNNNEIPEEDDGEDDEAEENVGGSRLLSFFKIDLEYAIVGEKSLVTRNALPLLFISTAFIVVACWTLVYSCEAIGEALGLHGYFVAVIVAAAASSVPDTILSIKDAKKGNYDDAVANALGSNIFDICFALGAPLFLYTLLYGPIDMDPNTISHITELRLLLLFLTIVTFFILLFNKKMTKTTASILVLMYLFFVVYIAGRAYGFGFATIIAEKLHIIQAIIQ